MLAGRLFSRARATGQLLAAFRSPTDDKPPAILIGKAPRIAETLKTLAGSEEGLPIRPLAILETTGNHEGMAISGVQVVGDVSRLEELMSVLTERYGSPPWIAMTGFTNDRETMDMVLEVAANFKTTIQRLYPTGEITREGISPTDLLARKERKLDPILVSELISGVRILVTGAGGTIGSELVKQCSSYGPAEITLFDSSEYNLYEIDMYMARHQPNITRHAMLGNVRDKDRLKEVIEQVRPDVLIHAAALKHVPLMETNPNEAILTNIEGARNAAELATECGINHFVFISTDKAVQPSNVMGASKRTAELFIQALGPTQSQTNFSIVRFGNVLGSAGSVVPLFDRQIEEGGPVTVTDPGMTRYFMSIEEASSLVLQAAALSSRINSKNTNLYVLEMGNPVAIKEISQVTQVGDGSLG
jgi:O-antigen biosynthesis protein WbqV